MFQALARGIPSFGDLSWKAPVVAASDPSQVWSFPVPVLAPVGAAVPGQTMTAGANEAITAAPPFAGMTIVAGNRVLVTTDSGLANSNGIWVVTVVGSGASKWVLTRATDDDTAAERVTGSLVLAYASLLSGVIYTTDSFWQRASSTTWAMFPTLLEALTIILSLDVGDGSLVPAATIHGGIALDAGDFIQGGAGPVVNVYTANATWTKPAGLHHIEVVVTGAGGAGGGCATTTAAQSSVGGGGGGGGTARKVFLEAALPASCTVVRGTGGTVGAAGANAGNAGGLSSFAGTGITTVQGNGGAGGSGGAASAGPARIAGGAGGTATGGNTNHTGGDGQVGTIVRGDVAQGDVGQLGNGGGSGAGMGQMQSGPSSSQSGAAGVAYGGGGAGGFNANSQVTARTGGAGSNGVVTVTEYYAP